jgi:hypothetical protein
MESLELKNVKSTTEDICVRMVLDAWNSKLGKADQLLAVLSDEDLSKEVSPGRNRGIYLLGHLIAVHDKMISLLGLGESLYPEFSDMFLVKPDKSGAAIPSAEVLRACWKQVNETLKMRSGKLQAKEWFLKHTSVSEQDFANEPHRNRLNVIISRTNHLEYHLGQLVFLKK